MQQITQEITRSLPKAIQTIQDVGYYALGGPNLSKLCVPYTFEFLILATPYLQTHHLGGIPRWAGGGKTPSGGTRLRGNPSRIRAQESYPSTF
jgi:hypothetical protein